MGKKLKELRKQLGLSQDQVADKLHCYREKLSRYENDRMKHPDYYFICSLAYLYNVSCDYFFQQEVTIYD